MLVQGSCKDRLERYFRENGVDYVLEHHPAAYTARGVAASEHVVAARVAKTVIVVADGRLAMVVVPASEDVVVARLPEALHARHVRVGEESEFESTFADCAVGAMPPFGNLYGMPVYVDASLAEFDTIRFEAGTYTDTMCIKYADFLRLVNPTVVSVGRPHEAMSVTI